MKSLLIVIFVFAVARVSFCDESNEDRREIFDLTNQYKDESKVYKNVGVYGGYKSGVGHHTNYPNSYSYGGNHLNYYNGYNNNQNNNGFTPINDGYTSIVEHGHTTQSYPMPVRVPQPVIDQVAQPVHINEAGSDNGYSAGHFGNNLYEYGIYGNQKTGAGKYTSIEADSSGYGNERYTSGVYSVNGVGTNEFEYGKKKYGSGAYSSNDDRFENNEYELDDYENQKYGTGVYSSKEVDKNVYETGVFENQKYGSDVYSSNDAEQFGNNGYGLGDYENLKYGVYSSDKDKNVYETGVYGNQKYGSQIYSSKEGYGYGNQNYGSSAYGTVNYRTNSFDNIADYNSGKYTAQYGSGLYESQAENLKSNVYGSAYGDRYEINPFSDSAEKYNEQTNNYQYESNAAYNQDKDDSTDFDNSGASEHGPYNKYNENKKQATTYVKVKGKGYEYSYRY